MNMSWPASPSAKMVLPETTRRCWRVPSEALQDLARERAEHAHLTKACEGGRLVARSNRYARLAHEAISLGEDRCAGATWAGA